MRNCLPRWSKLIGVVIVFVCSGCGTEPDRTAAVPDRTTQVAASDRSSAVADADDAATVVNEMLAGLNQNRAEAVWQFLPTSFQRDVNDVVHEFAANVDAELWNRTFVILQKMVDVLRDQKQFILHSPASALSETQVAEMSARWEDDIDLLNSLVSSEISKLETLREIDVGTFLAGTGSRLLNQLRALSQLAVDDPLASGFTAATATLIETDGVTALLRLDIPHEQPREVEFIQVEGRWLPRKLAESWNDSIRELKTRVHRLSTETLETRQEKERAMATLDALESALDGLHVATSQAEFEHAAKHLWGEVVTAMLTGQSPADNTSVVPTSPSVSQTSKSKSRKGGTITIVVMEKLDRQQASDVSGFLLDILDQQNELGGQAIYSTFEFTTEFEISPVDDIEKFAERIAFGRVLKVDASKRTISVDIELEED